MRQLPRSCGWGAVSYNFQATLETNVHRQIILKMWQNNLWQNNSIKMSQSDDEAYFLSSVNPLRHVVHVNMPYLSMIASFFSQNDV
jgi:hypothetical protein